MKPIQPSSSNKSRYITVGMLALVLAGGVASFLKATDKRGNTMLKKTDIVTITLPPPPLPPPPPPPPPPPQTKEPEMVEQTPVDQIEQPVETPAEAPADPGLSTNIAGNGPDMGLRAGSGGGGNRHTIGTGRRAGKWDHYAVAVQNTIAETLRRTADVRSASFALKVRVWADASGRITRANLMGSSGVSAVDQAIRNQALTGLQLSEPPPSDMPMPITMRISARKPTLANR